MCVAPVFVMCVAWHCVVSGLTTGPGVIKCLVTGAAPVLDR